ncbi:MAG: transcription antitermination protein NusB [Desulfovibrionales bacterium]|jgi:N utilization substance protein B|nr:transcription antitermination protein NusB [Desulfovibrionales bacterium]
MAKKSPRRSGRRLAFQVLYGLDASRRTDCARAFDENPAVLEQGGGEASDFARTLACGVWEKLPALDEVIGKLSKRWRLERIAKVELAILRLGLYEILYCQDIPLKVAINEAVELAKRYGDENSGTFINGILDAAAKAVDHGELGIRHGS